MATNRKDHRKACRMNGIRRKEETKKRVAHEQDLRTLQKVLDHSAQLQSKHPELFAAVMQTVNNLAVQSGVSVEKLMRDGTMVIGDDGHKIMKSPQDILSDIAMIHPAFNTDLTEAPSIERIREAHDAVKSGVNSLDLKTCSDTALQEAIACGHQPAITEWLRRHPEAEASDGGRLG